MKKRTWISIALLAVCLVTFFGYRTVKRLRVDKKAPQIDVSAGVQQISVKDTADALLQGITAKDDTDGDVTASLVVEQIRLLDSDGNASVSYAAFDRAGNVAKISRQVRYSDYESPRFSLDSPLLFTQGVSMDVLGHINATDVFDGDITRRVRATSLSENTGSDTGVHEVVFRVTNSMGDTVELILPVEVYSAGSYQAALRLTDYLIYLPVGADFHAKDYLDSFTVGQDDISLKNGLADNMSLKTSGTVDTQNPGVYSVGYLITQTVRNTGNREEGLTYKGYSKLIVVVEE